MEHELAPEGRVGLCENPECGAFLDRPPTLHFDRYTDKPILLCRECTLYFATAEDPRYIILPT